MADKLLIGSIALVVTVWGGVAWWLYRRNVLHYLKLMVNELRLIARRLDHAGNHGVDNEEEAPDPNP